MGNDFDNRMLVSEWWKCGCSMGAHGGGGGGGCDDVIINNNKSELELTVSGQLLALILVVVDCWKW